MSGVPPLVAVLALGRNGAFGRDGGLPWTMPSDLARFRALTMGKPMIMGRRTYQAIGRPLPGRESIVVSRHADFALPPGAYRMSSPGDAVEAAQRRAVANGAKEVVVIGGAAIFTALMGRIDRIHLTIVDLSPAADIVLPWPDPYQWREVARQASPAGPGDEADCVFLDYVRALPPARL